MKIGIDARLIQETGVGRYIRNLLRYLSEIDDQNEYLIFLPPKVYDSFSLPNERWQKRLVSVHWHTLREQIILPLIFKREKLDLLHVPYFTIPLLYPGKVIVTIHDITILHFRTGKSTTLPYPLYFLKWLAYQIILTLGVKKASSIITVSESVKQDIQNYLKVAEEKIVVTYEGIDPVFEKMTPIPSPVTYDYFLYVGNVYPHKQAEFLLESYANFLNIQRSKGIKNIPKLIFVGKNDFFYEKLHHLVDERSLSEYIVFRDRVTDAELCGLYQHAIALVFPSLSEGFGLPSLEALSQHCQLLVSDIPVFHELLENKANYIKHNLNDWSTAMEQSWLNGIKEISSNDIDMFLKKFSWKKLAVRTKEIYETSTGIR